MNSTAQTGYSRREDELDLGQLVRFLWQGRWRVVAIAASAVMTVLLYYGFSYLSPSANREYSSIVQLTFPTADSGEFPNGSRFVISDIGSSDVLRKVHEEFNLASFGLELTEFTGRINVRPYAVTEDFIAQRYKERLGQKGLSTTEIEALESSYKEELQRNAKRFARISFSLERNSPISAAVVEDILAAIPRVWSEISITQRGVLDTTLISVAGLKTEGMLQEEYAVTLQRLRDYSDYIKAGLRSMLEDSRLRVIRDPQSGMLPRDLGARIDELNEYQVLPLQLEVMEHGHTRNPELAASFFRARLQDLQEKRDEIFRKADVYLTGIRHYNQSGMGAPAASGGTEGTSVMISGEYVDRMLEIGGKLSESDFRQQLVARHLEYLVAAEELNTRIAELQRQLEAVRPLASSARRDASGVNERAARAVAEFEYLKQAYARLADEARNVALGNGGQLYRLLSVRPEISDPLSGNLARLVLLVLLAFCTGTILGLMVHLLYAALLPPQPDLAPASEKSGETSELESAERVGRVAGIGQ